MGLRTDFLAKYNYLSFHVVQFNQRVPEISIYKLPVETFFVASGLREILMSTVWSNDKIMPYKY